MFSKNKIIKYFICLFLLFKEYKKNRNILIFSFQANIYAIIFAKILNIKIITRSNSSPSGWSKNPLKKILFKFLSIEFDSLPKYIPSYLFDIILNLKHVYFPIIHFYEHIENGKMPNYP
mgnify:CR=1 FL=1